MKFIAKILGVALLAALSFAAPARAQAAHQAVLGWTASTTSGVTYSVFRGTTAGGESTTAIVTGLSALTYTDTTVAGGTTYYYTVEAVLSGVASVPSNEVSAVIPATVAPPTALKVVSVQ